MFEVEDCYWGEKLKSSGAARPRDRAYEEMAMRSLAHLFSHVNQFIKAQPLVIL